MTFYLGRAADGFAALRSPDRGIEPTATSVTNVHQASSGARVVDLSPRAMRTYRMAWSWMDPDTYSVLEEFRHGARGDGPFVLLDPGRRNHLAANQASATSSRNDVTGFRVPDDSGEVLGSSSTLHQRGPRALRWSLPATVVSGLLSLDPPTGLEGFPLPAGQPWTFSGTVSLAGVLSSLNVTPALSWRALGGAEIAATLGTPVAAVPGAWTSWSVSLATPPAGAVYVLPQLRVAPGVLTTAGVQTNYDYPTQPRRPRRGTVRSWATGPLQPVMGLAGPRASKPGQVIIVAAPSPLVDLVIDKLQLDMSATARAWVMGTGIPQVTMTALSEEYRLLPDRNCAATFVEVGI